MVRVFVGGALGIAALIVLAFWANWQLSTPSHDRDWQALYARLPQVDMQGDSYLLRDIRNWSYQETGSGTPIA